MLAAVARGESRLRHLNHGSDVRATAAALAACGAALELRGDDAFLSGAPLADPPVDLDLGNSGTGARLLAGLLAGAGLRARITGDASLRARPMDRIVDPLRAMGADVAAEGPAGGLPLRIGPARLRPLAYALPVPSAQVKSCLLLAGLTAGVEVRLREPAPTRDHTERLLLATGARLKRLEAELVLTPGGDRLPLDLRVPGDFSSAAFFLVLAALVPELDLLLTGVGVNPGRTGLLQVLAEMGADVQMEDVREEGGEPVTDLRARHAGRLRALDVPPELAPSLIDEVPALAILAARADGVTRIRGVGELRVKESDRLRSLAEGLRAVGIDARETADGLEVEGSTHAPRGAVDTRGDHRIAMAFAVLGRVPAAEIRLSETDSIATSFPEFPDLLNVALG